MRLKIAVRSPGFGWLKNLVGSEATPCTMEVAVIAGTSAQRNWKPFSLAHELPSVPVPVDFQPQQDVLAVS